MLIIFRFEEIVDEVLSDDEMIPPRYKSRSDQRRVREDNVPDKSRGMYSVRDTQKVMQKERQFGKKKLDVCVRDLFLNILLSILKRWSCFTG